MKIHWGIHMKTHHGFSISMSVYRRVQCGMRIDLKISKKYETEPTDRNGC